MSSTTETSAAVLQKTEVEHNCVEKRKRRKNESIWHENASIPDKNDNKDKRTNIISEERDNRRVADMEHQIQHFKAKAYCKASNNQRYIKTHQEKFDILEEMMEAEREDGRQKMHFLEEELAETRKKSSETVAETRCDAWHQIYEMEDKVYAKF